jgi:hypothetical protein
MQLVLGSFLAPKLLKWVEAEKARLGEEGEDDNGGVLKEEQQEETTKNEAPETSVIENDYEESAEC